MNVYPVGVALALPTSSAAAAAEDVVQSLASWVAAHCWGVFVAALLAVPAVALVQGIFFLLRYRLRHGDAPVPLLPAHGVVVVSPHDRHEVAPRDDVVDDGLDDECGRGTKEVLEIWRRRLLLETAAALPPLRLLVVGDSLAAGVGVSWSCTPVLPETVAKALSKALGGRAVYWTCIAEPGASSGWIVRELNEEMVSQSSSCTATPSLPSPGDLAIEKRNLDESWRNDGDDEDSFSLSPSGRIEVDQPLGRGTSEEDELWRKRLVLHSKRLKSEVFGEYDVAIVMTGLNDLKGAFLPFLLTGDEVEFRRQARERGGDYGAELKRVVDAVADKMKVGLRESLERLIHVADRVKRKLAERYPCAILYVDAPSPLEMSDFEHQRGRRWDARCAEETVMSLNNVCDEERKRVELEMKQYYEPLVTIRRQSGGKKPRRGRRHDAPGASLLSIDGIHLNDMGYGFWARCIAEAIVQEWEKGAHAHEPLEI